MDIKETSPSRELRHDQIEVGLTAIQLTNLAFKFKRGVLLRAFGPGDDVENTAPVYVGGPRVDPESGLPLLPGQSVVIPVENPDKVYLVASAASVGVQRVAWMGV